MMTDNELSNLYYLGETYTLARKAWEHIEYLEQQLCNKVDYIKILKDAVDKVELSSEAKGRSYGWRGFRS